MTLSAHKVIWNRIICQYTFEVHAKNKQSKYLDIQTVRGRRRQKRHSAHKKRKTVEIYAFEKQLCGLISSLVQNRNGSFPKYLEKKSSRELCFMTSQNELARYMLQKCSTISHGILCPFEVTTWIALFSVDSFPVVLYDLILKISWKIQYLQLREALFNEVLPCSSFLRISLCESELVTLSRCWYWEMNLLNHKTCWQSLLSLSHMNFSFTSALYLRACIKAVKHI